MLWINACQYKLSDLSERSVFHRFASLWTCLLTVFLWLSPASVPESTRPPQSGFKKKKKIVWIKYVVRSFAQTVIIILSTIQLQVVSSKSGVSWAGSCALTTLAASLQPHQRQFFFLKSNTLQLALQLMLNQLRSIFFHLINNGSNERTYVMELVCSDEPTENSAAL